MVTMQSPHPNISDRHDGSFDPDQEKRRRVSVGSASLAVLAIALVVLSGSVAALEGGSGGSCDRKGKSGECKSYGEIWMDNSAEIRGEPVQLTTDIYLNTNFENMGARWVMFSVRNITWDGADPVRVSVDSFKTEHGEIITTREDRTENKVDLWVDVMDLPVGTPITIETTVGSTEKGAYMLETLVLAFDRGYDPIHDQSGTNVALFASTHLGVNQVTGSSGGLTSKFQNVPGVAPMVLVAAIGLAAVLLAGRRSQ